MSDLMPLVVKRDCICDRVGLMRFMLLWTVCAPECQWLGQNPSQQERRQKNLSVAKQHFF